MSRYISRATANATAFTSSDSGNEGIRHLLSELKTSPRIACEYRCIRRSFELDPESGALYVRLRDGEYTETVPLTPGLGVDIDCEGNVLGVEFLSFEEYAELVAKTGGKLEIPERIEDPAHFRLSPA